MKKSKKNSNLDIKTLLKKLTKEHSSSKLLSNYIDSTYLEITAKIEHTTLIQSRTISTKKNNITKLKVKYFLEFLEKSFGLTFDKKYTKKNLEHALIEVKKSQLKLTKKAPKDMIVATKLFEECNRENLLSKFKEIYKTDNITKYYHLQIMSIYNWACDNTTLLSETQFLNTLSTAKVKGNIKKDIDLYLYQKSYEDNKKKSKTSNAEKSNSKTIASNTQKAPYLKQMDIFPMDYTMHVPMDPSNRKKTSLDGGTFKYEHKINEAITVTTIIDVPDYNDSEAPPKLFNLFDNKVIKHLIKLSNDNFLSTKTVICPLSTLVESIDPSRSGKTYDATYNSLRKMTTFQTRLHNCMNNSFTYFEVYRAEIIPRNGQDATPISEMQKPEKKTYRDLIVKVIFSQKYIDLLLAGVVATNSELKFEHSLTEALLPCLQCKRYEAVKLNKYETELDFDFFNSNLVLGTRNKARYITQITAALLELVKLKTIIESVRVIGDIFYIKFLPIEYNEKESLMQLLDKYSSAGTPIKLPYNLDLSEISPYKDMNK